MAVSAFQSTLRPPSGRQNLGCVASCYEVLILSFRIAQLDWKYAVFYAVRCFHHGRQTV